MAARRVTIRDIAREASVHFTTVSRALSRHPSIPEETCLRIRKIAERLGYTPDPMLSALMSYRTKLRTPVYHGNIAWIDNYPERAGWRKHEIYCNYYEGSKLRAEQLGYKLEEFWLREPGLTFRRAGEILSARNIHGLLLCPQPFLGTKIDLEWDRFSSVTFGYTLVDPPLHRVASHTSFSMTELIQQVRALGCRRLGYVIEPSRDERIFNLWSGIFLTHQMRWPRAERIPLQVSEKLDSGQFLKWFKQYRPDVIISQNTALMDVLEKAGYRVPRDVNFALPSLETHPRNPSGVNENSIEMGRAAVDMLVGMVHRNERGIPSIPYYLLVKGEWHSGTTTTNRSTKPARVKNAS